MGCRDDAHARPGQPYAGGAQEDSCVPEGWNLSVGQIIYRTQSPLGQNLNLRTYYAKHDFDGLMILNTGDTFTTEIGWSDVWQIDEWAFAPASIDWKTLGEA